MPLDLEPIKKRHADSVLLHGQRMSVCERDRWALIERVEELEAERSAVIDVLNIYAEPIVHEVLDTIGVLNPRAAALSENNQEAEQHGE